MRAKAPNIYQIWVRNYGLGVKVEMCVEHNSSIIKTFKWTGIYTYKNRNINLMVLMEQAGL